MWVSRGRAGGGRWGLVEVGAEGVVGAAEAKAGAGGRRRVDGDGDVLGCG